MKNDAAPWDRLISTDHELELPWGEGGRSFVNFKNWYHRNGFLKYLVWIIERLYFSYFYLLPISRVEASRQEMEITANLECWNMERVSRRRRSRRRRRRKKFIPSNPVTVSGPWWFQRFLSLDNFVQNHPMSEYNEENLTVAGNRDHKRPIHRPKVQDLSLSVDEERRERWRAAHSLGETTPPFSHARGDPSGRRSRRRSSSSKIETEDRVVPL